MNPLLHTILALVFALGCFGMGVWAEHGRAAQRRREMLWRLKDQHNAELVEAYKNGNERGLRGKDWRGRS